MYKSLFLLASMALSSPAAAATNLVTNGGFESGNVGFTSTYNYVLPSALPGANNMTPENTYTVGINAINQHNSWLDLTAKTGSNYLIANGSGKNNAPVWSQVLNGLTIGQKYDFSAFAVNVCCNSTFGGPNISPLIISISSLGTIATSGALGSPGTWTPFSGSFVADSTSTTLSIFTDVNDLSGNDFGLDDISVTAAVPEPATWMMMMLGIGLIGFSLRRKKPTIRVQFA